MKIEEREEERKNSPESKLPVREFKASDAN